MHDLQLVGVHSDGDHLLLIGGDGQRYRVLIDDSLRAAVRRDRARLGQLQIAMEGALRPKDIQARIRSGQSAEEVAAASGLPIEHVRRYEGAVLAEREHVARRARSITVRRRQGQAPGLEELAVERLTARDAADTREWDAWRRDDGSWTVRLSFRTGSKERTAHWRFDLVTTSLEPLDDEARWLTADTDGEAGPVAGRRLTAVRERVYDVEADGGVREQTGAAAPDGHESPQTQETHGERERRRTVDLLETLRGRRGRRQPVADPDDPAADVLPDEELADEAAQELTVDRVLHIDEILGALPEPGEQPDQPRGELSGELQGELQGEQQDQPGDLAATDGLLDEEELAAAMRASEAGPVDELLIVEHAPAAHPPASRPEQATDARILALPGPEPEVRLPDEAPDEAPGANPGTDPGTDGGSAAAAQAPSDKGSGRRSRSKRAAVPSWDDIVFGARRE